MLNTYTYSQTGLGRLAVALLRQSHPTNMEEGRATLRSALGVYTPDTHVFDRAINDYFRAG
jgi:hypothetical protein